MELKYIYLVGFNNEAIECIKIAKNNNINICGLINDFTDDEFFNEIKVIKSTEINLNYPIINCSTSVSPVDTQKYFESLGSNVINLTDFIYEYTGVLPECFSNFSTYKKLISNLEYSLSDEQSINEFKSVVEYRSSGNLNAMMDFKVKTDQQYLDISRKIKLKSFMDVGGFDGDTSELLLKNIPSLKNIHIFEPNNNNLKAAKKRLSEYSCVKYHNIGLGEKSFNTKMSAEGSSSKIDATGNIDIVIKSLDELPMEQVDLIKIDIEGAELDFLNGAREYISNYNPNIAIAVYHKNNDLIEIPKFMDDVIKGDYKIYFRHYTQGWSESILYYIKPQDIII